MLKRIMRLGEPLARGICAYRGGVTARIIEYMKNHIEKVSLKKRPKGVPPRQEQMDRLDLKVLERNETPPPGLIFLEGVEGAKDAAKFKPKILPKDGLRVIEIPLNSPAVKPKRLPSTSGMIYSMVQRGDRWLDRAGHEHTNPY